MCVFTILLIGRFKPFRNRINAMENGPMDIATLLASAAISALVGTLVSLAAVSQTTVRRMRAEQAEEARRRIAGLLSELRRDVMLYRMGSKHSMQREANTYHSSDFVLASDIDEVADPLPWWRRALIHRRLRIVVGKNFADLAQIHRIDAERSLGSMIGPLLFQQVNDPKHRAGSATLLDGLLHRALSPQAEPHLVKKLERQLRLLARCW